MRGFGILCVVSGAIWALFALNMDTSISSGFGRVNNVGLMADRQNYVMMSIAILVIGVLLFVFGKRSLEPDVATSSVADAGLRPCPLCAEPIKKEAIKCKHCGSVVEAFVEDVPALGAFFKKPEGMSIGEYQEQFIERYAVVRSGNGYKWDQNNFNSFHELTEAVKVACQ